MSKYLSTSGPSSKTVAMGLMGKDPEMSYLDNGTAVVKFSVSTTIRAKDPNGKYQYATEWHGITAFAKSGEDAQYDNAAERIANMGYKGCPVVVDYDQDVMLIEKDNGNWEARPKLFENKGYADCRFGGVATEVVILGTKSQREAARGTSEETGESKPAGGKIKMAGGAAPAVKSVAAPAAGAPPWDDTQPEAPEPLPEVKVSAPNWDA